MEILIKSWSRCHEDHHKWKRSDSPCNTGCITVFRTIFVLFQLPISCLSVFVHYPMFACFFFHLSLFLLWNNFFFIKYFVVILLVRDWELAGSPPNELRVIHVHSGKKPWYSGVYLSSKSAYMHHQGKPWNFDPYTSSNCKIIQINRVNRSHIFGFHWRFLFHIYKHVR